MVSSTVFECLRPYIDDFVGVCRALCMDPAGDVIIEGCLAMSGLADTSGDNLMHFCHDMGRSLFTAFSHRHAKVRMAGLKCLFSVMGCGIWKTSVYVLEGMVGFRDPNIVPIKDFYEPSTKLNYFALFVGDRSTVCRELFYVTMGKMLTSLPDKYDHEGRLFPYIISALYDDNDGICSTGFDILEEVGQLHETENEEKLREVKQFAYKNEWSLNGLIPDSELKYPHPICQRPRLGARIMVERTFVATSRDCTLNSEIGLKPPDSGALTFSCFRLSTPKITSLNFWMNFWFPCTRS